METSPSALTASTPPATTKKAPQDVIIIFESSGFVSVCYESILENYIRPMVKYFYNLSAIDELGLTKEVNNSDQFI